MSYRCKNFFLLKNNPWCLKIASQYYILKNYFLINVKIILSCKDLISFNSVQILQILLSSALDFFFFFMALDFMFYVHQSLCWCNGFWLLLFSSNYFLVFYLLFKVYLGTFTFFFLFSNLPFLNYLNSAVQLVMMVTGNVVSQ